MTLALKQTEECKLLKMNLGLKLQMWFAVESVS